MEIELTNLSKAIELGSVCCKCEFSKIKPSPKIKLFGKNISICKICMILNVYENGRKNINNSLY